MELHAARSAGRRIFFGEDDDRRGPYWPGAQDVPARERRFLGWFLFGFRLPDGRLPAELAVERLRLADQDDVLRAVQGHRYVLAVVSTILSAGTVFLESVEQVQLVTNLASEIWNATPQPDRGGLTARELNQLNRLQREQ